MNLMWSTTVSLRLLTTLATINVYKRWLKLIYVWDISRFWFICGCCQPFWGPLGGIRKFWCCNLHSPYSVAREAFVKQHSQKQSAHWAQVVPCWLGRWLSCNLWLVLGQWNQLAFQLIQLDITRVHCLNAPDSGVSSRVNIKSLGSASFEHLNLPCV